MLMVSAFSLGVGLFWLLPESRGAAAKAVFLFAVVSALVGAIGLVPAKRLLRAHPHLPEAWRNASGKPTGWPHAPRLERRYFFAIAAFEVFAFLFCGIGLATVLAFATLLASLASA